MKYRVKRNQWGNWNGYEGSKRVEEFGTDGNAAADWLTDMRIEADPFIKPVVDKLTSHNARLFEALKQLENALESGDPVRITAGRDWAVSVLNFVTND